MEIDKRELRYIFGQFSLKHCNFGVLILLQKSNNVFQSMADSENHAVINLSFPVYIMNDIFVFMTKINSNYESFPSLV